MNKFKKYLGLIVILLSFILVSICVILAPEFDITKDVISDLGAIPSVALIFNLTMIVNGIFLLKFITFVGRAYKWKFLVHLAFLASSFGLILIGLFPVKLPLVWDLQRYMHWTGAGLFFLGLPIGVILLNITKKVFSSYLQIIWGIFSILIPVFFWSFTSYRGIAELMGIVLNTAWLLVLSITVINNRKVK